MFFSAAQGHYVFMKKTYLRAAYKATMETAFLYLEDSCLQLFHYLILGSSEMQIFIKLRQEVSFCPSFIIYASEQGLSILPIKAVLLTGLKAA